MKGIGRVAFVLPSLEYSGPTYNGLTLSREFSGEGVRCITVSLEGGERESSYSASELPFLVDKNAGRFLRGNEARKKVRDFDVDVVHALDLSVLPIGMRLAVRDRKPLVVTINRALQGNERHLSLLSECRVVAVSDSVRNEVVRAAKLDRDKVSVIHNGVDMSRHKLPENPNYPTDDEGWGRLPVVGTFGSLLPHKGQKYFIESIKKILDGFGEVEFVIMGRGPDQFELREYADKLGVLNRVTFTSGASFATAATDRVASKQESVFLRDFDVFVEPSTQEGLGLSVMQAMAWARPVVASAAGGLYDLVDDEETGYLVQKESSDAIATRVVELLKSPTKCREMGLRGREKISKEFDIREIAKKHLDFYARAVKEMPDGV